jgi:hypothetical protein
VTIVTGSHRVRNTGRTRRFGMVEAFILICIFAAIGLVAIEYRLG